MIEVNKLILSDALENDDILEVMRLRSQSLIPKEPFTAFGLPHGPRFNLLGWAAYYGALKTVTHLLNKAEKEPLSAASPTSDDFFNQTQTSPILAVMANERLAAHRRSDMVELLLSRGFAWKLSDGKGGSPWDRARQLNDWRCFQLFWEEGLKEVPSDELGAWGAWSRIRDEKVLEKIPARWLRALSGKGFMQEMKPEQLVKDCTALLHDKKWAEAKEILNCIVKKDLQSENDLFRSRRRIVLYSLAEIADRLLRDGEQKNGEFKNFYSFIRYAQSKGFGSDQWIAMDSDRRRPLDAFIAQYEATRLSSRIAETSVKPANRRL